MFLLALLSACDGPAPPPQTNTLVPAATVENNGTPHSLGASVYVPVYSSIYVAEGNESLELTITLSVRNTDRDKGITVKSVDYFDKSGKLLHSYLDAPTTLAPLASADTVVRESDTRAGVGGSFVVEWSAAEEVSEPVVQAIMIGAKYQQGISFVSEGRVIARHGAP